ncbi:hypothetical protein NQ314_011380 [Rhamnusium bicolor]|uniref:Uncharacterized protein n=1 Tax=Rhamnusium bicolor TaxID=1586634 RepID=A0AAV8XI26_9CUCU|nr:hypothetical protein NQ314_011380 [Rhamnusium bicolor]
MIIVDSIMPFILRATLDINNRTIRTVLQKKNSNGFVLSDLRGKHENHHKNANECEKEALREKYEKHQNEKNYPGKKKKQTKTKISLERRLKKIPVPKSGDPTPPGKPKWQYFEQMYFLKDFVVPSQTQGNLPILNENSTDPENGQCNEYDDMSKQAEYDDVMSPQPSHSSGPSRTPSGSGSITYKRKRNKTDLQEEFLQLENRKLEILQGDFKEDNADLLFFKTLLPHMNYKKFLYKHIKLCPKYPDLGIKGKTQTSQSLGQTTLADEIGLIVRTDTLICNYGYSYLKGRKSKGNLDLIRQDMRRLAKPLKFARNQNTEIKDR